MSLQSVADVPLIIISPNSSSERRISPSWSIAHLKTRLEPITGVPASSQRLSLRVGSQDAVALIADDEEQTQLGAFPLQPYAEITVSASSLCHCMSLETLSLGAPVLPSSCVPPHLSLLVQLYASLHRHYIYSLFVISSLRAFIRRVSSVRNCRPQLRHACVAGCPIMLHLSYLSLLHSCWQIGSSLASDDMEKSTIQCVDMSTFEVRRL